MAIIERSEVIPYTTQQMYDLVNDVAAYQKFLPWCSGSSVLSQTDDVIEAKIELKLGGISKAFSTRNRLCAGKLIEISLLDGPFHHLEGFWKFDADGEADARSTQRLQSRVTLNLEYEFANKLLSLAIGPAFSKIAGSLVAAFCDRAHEIYGAEATTEPSTP